jgi:hypothetical protein
MVATGGYARKDGLRRINAHLGRHALKKLCLEQVWGERVIVLNCQAMNLRRTHVIFADAT